MRRDKFASRFYGSYAWQQCRATVWQRAGGLCEKCLARGLIVPGVEVHHIKHLTPENVGDPAVALNPDNLILLCSACHHDEHEREVRYRTDEAGRVIW